ncbi:MAG TPA: F0F1 ATP synthase subunit A [bacterium]|nr:F0F1 ATP synthase subunit A [bacterium]
MEAFSVIAWFDNVLGLPPSWADEYLHVTMSFCAFLVITLVSFIAWLKLRRANSRLVPDSRGSLANIFEVLVESIMRMMTDAMGPSARRHLPLIGTLFVYILTCNLFGTVPGFTPPTDNINTNLACALVVFVYYNVSGVWTQGIRSYLKHMGGPIIWLAPLMFSVEVISHLVRPVSLSIRLFGNIAGDHIVLGIFSYLTPILVPIAFEALAIFVAFIQAFVFTLLSVIYISLATASEEN